MFKKNKKQTETIKEPKEKKVRTVKVGTHKKTVIALWVVLVASVSFGVYKNFTAIDQHTTHEKEIIELRLQDTNGIENFVKNFAKSYYTWNNSKEAIEARTQAINGYLTKELQDLNVDTIRTDIPTSSTVTDDPYISKCCLRPFYDKYGNVCIVVDMELKGRIREALIKMILDFDIPLETEE